MLNVRKADQKLSFSFRRALSLAIAMAGHVALLAVLLQPTTPSQTTPVRGLFDQNNVLVMHLLPRVPPRIESAPPSAPRPRSGVLPRRRRTTSTATPVPHVAATDSPIPLPQSSSAPAYIPGGRSFSSALAAATTPARSLPDGTPVKGMPRFRMANPQTQGLAGIARLFQVFTGTADPACVDVDRWGTMNEDERIAQHSSSADMTRIAIEHNCALAPDTKNR